MWQMNSTLLTYDILPIPVLKCELNPVLILQKAIWNQEELNNIHNLKTRKWQS